MNDIEHIRSAAVSFSNTRTRAIAKLSDFPKLKIQLRHVTTVPLRKINYWTNLPDFTSKNY